MTYPTDKEIEYLLDADPSDYPDKDKDEEELLLEANRIAR